MPSSLLPDSLVFLGLLVLVPFLLFLGLHLLNCVKPFDTLKAFTIADKSNSVGLLALISIPYGSISFYLLFCGSLEIFLNGFSWLYSVIGYGLAVTTGYYLITPNFYASQQLNVFSYLSARWNSSAITSISATVFVLLSFTTATVSLCSTVAIVRWLFHCDAVVTVLSTLLIWAVSMSIATVDGLYGLQVIDNFFCFLSVASSLSVGYFLYDFNRSQLSGTFNSFEALMQRSANSNVFGWISGSWCWFTFFLTLSPQSAAKLYGWDSIETVSGTFLSASLPGVFLFFYALLLGVFISVRCPNIPELWQLQKLFYSNPTALGIRGVAGGILSLLSASFIANLHCIAVVIGQAMLGLKKLRLNNFTLGLWKSRAVAAGETVTGLRLITLISGGVLLFICGVVIGTVEDLQVISALLPVCKVAQSLIVGPLLGLVFLGIFVPISNHQSALLAYTIGLITAFVLAVVEYSRSPVLPCQDCKPSGNSTQISPNATDFSSFHCDPMLSCFITTVLTLTIGFAFSCLTGGSAAQVEPNLVSPRCLRWCQYWSERQLFRSRKPERPEKRDRDRLERPKWIRAVRNSFRNAKTLLPDVIYRNPRVQRMQQESTL